MPESQGKKPEVKPVKSASGPQPRKAAAAPAKAPAAPAPVRVKPPEKRINVAPAGRKAEKPAAAPARAAGESRKSSPAPDKGKATEYIKWGVRAAVAAALLVAALIIVPPYLQAWKAKPVYDEAVAAVSAGDYEKALRLYREARQLAPKFADMQQKTLEGMALCYKDLGRDLFFKGEYAQAAQTYRDWLEFDRASAERGDAYLELAKCYEASSLKNPADLKQALEFAEKAAQCQTADSGGEAGRQLRDRLKKRADTAK